MSVIVEACLVDPQGGGIDLSEIERALRACSGVKDAAVVTRRATSGTAWSLAAYIELVPGVEGLLPRHIASMLAQRLPARMIPVDFVILAALPRRAGSEIDRAALGEMDSGRPDRLAARELDVISAAVVDAFKTVLGRNEIDPEDDLLSLGGDSMQAVAIALEIELALGVTFPPDVLELDRPIAELVGRLASNCAFGQGPVLA
jgi:acyl carrier protein